MSIQRKLQNIISVTALAAGLGVAGLASATTVTVVGVGEYQPTNMTASGADLPAGGIAELPSALDLQILVGNATVPTTLYTFCIDIYHSISGPVDNNHTIVTGNNDSQGAWNEVYTIAPLTKNSDSTAPGSGAALTTTQIAEIGGLANIGGSLITSNAADLSKKLSAIQGAIWEVEYPSAAGYSFTTADTTVSNYMAGYFANAVNTESYQPVNAIYGTSGQGQLFAAHPAGSGGNNQNPYGAVPEPATWALMLGGFGFGGAMLRRRRAIALAA